MREEFETETRMKEWEEIFAKLSAEQQKAVYEKLKIKSVMYRGLPPLKTSPNGYSPSCWNNIDLKRNKNIILEERPFEMTAIVHNPRYLSSSDLIWINVDDDEMLTYTSDGDLRMMIQFVLEDCRCATNIYDIFISNQFIHMSGDSVHTGLIMFLNHIPIGVVEIKRPWSDHQNVNRIYHSLKYIQSYHGLEQAFGIISSYDKWRVVWLSENNLHGTRLYSFDDKDLVQILCTVLMKMKASPINVFKLRDPKRLYIVMEQTGWSWQYFFKDEEKSLVWSEFRESIWEQVPPHVVFLKELQHNDNGRVMLSCFLNGQICVVKFLRYGSEREMEEEANNWKQTGINQVRVVTLNGKQALIMPYYKPVDDRPIEKTKLAIREYVSFGFKHEDLGWRHVAERDDGSIILIDRGQVCKIEKGEEEHAIKEMETSLDIQ